MYPVYRNKKYDFAGESYASSFPNLHRYPATMIPQIGINLFKELNISQGKLLDPYCGSGSSFIVGLESGLTEMVGFDINPLAILISRAKFSKVNLSRVKLLQRRLSHRVKELVKNDSILDFLKTPKIYNQRFWFSKEVLKKLSILYHYIDRIKEKEVKRLFLVPFSETIRESSYTRNSEFKLYKMKATDVLNFNPDVFRLYFNKLAKTIENYEKYYLPKLNNSLIEINFRRFPKMENYFDVVLTSPPYGDSKTTVAYGQFSTFSNEWFGIQYARQIDNLLMGGKASKELYDNGLIAKYIDSIAQTSRQRALQISSFYKDLQNSICDVSKSLKSGGTSIYIVGNRCVKSIHLPTDQFVAEQFEKNGFKHLFTYERSLCNKTMPIKNSPTNRIGKRRGTITKEFVVVSKKE